MADHSAFSNSDIMCGHCRVMMRNSKHNGGANVGFGEGFVWRVVCAYEGCPHHGITYDVQPNVRLIRTEGVGNEYKGG
jgi:hypothetical protein